MAELYTWPGILTALLEKRDLSVSESTWAMRRIMSGEATPSQLGGFLVALRAKGETVDEIVDLIGGQVVEVGADRRGERGDALVCGCEGAHRFSPIVRRGRLVDDFSSRRPLIAVAKEVQSVRWAASISRPCALIE